MVRLRFILDTDTSLMTPAPATVRALCAELRRAGAPKSALRKSTLNQQVLIEAAVAGHAEVNGPALHLLGGVRGVGLYVVELAQTGRWEGVSVIRPDGRVIAEVVVD